VRNAIHWAGHIAKETANLFGKNRKRFHWCKKKSFFFFFLGRENVTITTPFILNDCDFSLPNISIDPIAQVKGLLVAHVASTIWIAST